MLHLFNKVYLEFDDKIEINFDRIVISNLYGSPMLEQLDKVAYGKLIAYGKNYESVIGDDFIGFISTLKNYGDSSGKKIIIYCDQESYKRVMANWFKTVLPELDLDTFKNIVNYTVYNQRIVSNSQLSSVYSVDLNSLWSDIGEVEEAWSTAVKPSSELVTNLDLNYSYEFLIASYLADGSKKEELRKTLHMFLRRWFKEMFTDNRQMVLFNIVNHRFLSTFDIDPGLIDITSIDPLATVDQFESYSDDEIWERNETAYGLCKLEGLSEEKAIKLMDTLIKVFDEFEGMQIDRSVFGLKKYIISACSDSLSDEDMDGILEYVVENPFDTCIVPRFDFQNVNFPLMQFFLSEKFNERDLSKYRLL